MSQDVWKAVDRFFADSLARPDAALKGALSASAEAGLPAISVSPNLGKLLHILARSIGARRILEVGALGGYSTIWMARALPAGGRLITLESSADHARVAAANVERAGLSDVVEIRVGSAHDALPQLIEQEHGPFDFIFLDADKASLPEYFDWSLELSRMGTLIIADNVVRNGAVVDAASDDESVQGVRRFLSRVAAQPRVDATAMQTVGEKGYDGLAVVLVTG